MNFFGVFLLSLITGPQTCSARDRVRNALRQVFTDDTIRTLDRAGQQRLMMARCERVSISAAKQIDAMLDPELAKTLRCAT